MRAFKYLCGVVYPQEGPYNRLNCSTPTQNLSTMSFTNLIRFRDERGRVLFGDIPESSLNNLVGAFVTVLSGDPFEGGVSATSDKAVVKEVSACIF